MVKATITSMKGVKRVTVPNQSMSLREIVTRFVRRESLPIGQDGVYEERFGDLEKISKADIYDQMEYANNLRQKVLDYNKRIKDIEDKSKADALLKSQEHPPKTAGEPPVKPPDPSGSVTGRV